MRKAILFTVLSMAFSTSAYEGVSASSLWTKITSNEYENRPYYKVTLGSLSDGFSNLISKAANRTIKQKADFLPTFRKLVHPNGVCLKGEWVIDKENRYSGVFKKGSQFPFIGRASLALSYADAGKRRGFGLAGKVFPSVDVEQTVKTANFFVIDDLIGTKNEYFLNAPLINDADFSLSLSLFKNIFLGAKIAKAFNEADLNPGIRQVYQLSEALGGKNIVTPKWFMVHGRSGQNILHKDFRNELDIELRGRPLYFDIFVSSSVKRKNANWKKIGYIRMDQSALTPACDQNLHFNHPKWREDLVH